MPAIWNVSNSYNLNNKKMSSKLTFEVGEKFKGRIVSSGDGDEVIIKLADGWQFEAEVQGEIEGSQYTPLQFQVEGFEDGKLKLKIIKKEENFQQSTLDGLEEVIDKEGLGKDDIVLLKKMIQHNISLSRENITFIKGILQFNAKINIDEGEIDSFIEKFLSGKGISPNTQEGQNIKTLLNDFFVNFKSMKPEEILLFLENNIDFTSENIESYKKLFNSDSSVKEYFDDIGQNLKNIDVDVQDQKLSDIKPKEILEDARNLLEDNKNKSMTNTLASKVYDSNDISKGRISMLSLLKAMVGADNDLLREPIKDILLSLKNDITTNEFNIALDNINNMSDDDVIKLLKEAVVGNGDSKVITKENISTVLSKIFNKDIEITDSEFKKISDIIEFKLKDGNINEETLISRADESINSLKETKEDVANVIIREQGKAQISSKDLVKEEIKAKIEGMKDIIKEIIVNSQGKGKGIEKVMDLIRNNINDFKLFNSISNEYYYMDIPINQFEKEYQCKLIIKDNRKDGKKIDKTNVKLVVSVKTPNLGTVDGYLSIRENRLDVNLKCEADSFKVLNLSKDKLAKDLQELGFIINISVSKKSEEVTLTSCRDFFNDNTVKAIDIKV